MNYSHLLLLLLFLFVTTMLAPAQTCADKMKQVLELYKAGNVKGAVQLAEEQQQVCKKEYGLYSEGYLVVLEILSGLYNITENIPRKKQIYLELLDVVRNVKSEMNEDYGIYLNNLAGIYEKEGNYAATVPLYEQAGKVFKQLKGEKSAEYATILFNFGSMYLSWEKYDKAEKLMTETLQLRRVLSNGQDDEEVAFSLNNLGLLYKRMGLYAKAEPFYLDALQIRKRLLGVRQPDYAVSLNNIALLYNEMGEMAKEEAALLEAIDVVRNSRGEENSTYATFLSNLGLHYDALGNYEKAGPLLQRAVEIHKKTSGTQSPDYIRSLNNLALYCKNSQQYQKSESYYLETLRLNRIVMGAESGYYAMNLSNLGDLYLTWQLYDKAEQYQREAAALFKKINGENHPDYARAINNLAAVLGLSGKTGEAEGYYMESEKLRKRIYGEQHPEYAITLSNLATNYTLQKKYAKADTLFVKAIRIFRDEFRRAFTFMSSQEAEAFLEKQKSIETFIAAFVYLYPQGKTSEALLDYYLMLKGALLQNNQQLFNEVVGSNDTIVQNRWKQYKELRIRINTAYQQAGSDPEQTKEWERAADTFEKQLMGLLPVFRQSLENSQISWKEVQKALKPGEAAVEFFSMNLFHQRITDTVVYGAFIIKSGQQRPQYVSLCPEKELKELFSAANSSDHINQLYRGSEEQEGGVLKLSQAFYQLLWKPMESVLAGVRRVYVSPSGLLHRISFAAIPVSGTEVLADRYDLRMVSALRRIGESNHVSPAANRFVIAGGVNYNLPPAGQVEGKKEPSSFVVASGNRIAWQYLPGTLSEVQAIQTLSTKLKIRSTVFTAEQASEEAIRELSHSNQSTGTILHIATHGFSFPIVRQEVTKEVFVSGRNFIHEANDPLMRAGLVMAGANRFWTTGTNYPGREDGILTAREITNLDFRGFQLVTLSACETGLGDIKGSEGVFGLQRAFKMAGAGNLIISLWQVPDKETAEFMTTFYGLWLGEKKEIHEAFRQTQRQLSKKYDPFHWGAFVLVD